jgi:hypothetical protein
VLRSNTRTALTLALASAALTLIRMLLGDTRSTTEVLWAEDGYFPLCARNDGAINCLFQSYAGYFLLVPRIGAGVVSFFPYEAWPLASTAFAALVTGFSSLVVYLALRQSVVSVRSSALAALVLPLSPLFGIEVVGVLASAYVPLLVASGVTVVVVSPGRRSGTAVLILLLISALTMPSTVVFLGVIAIRLLAGDLSRKWASLWAAVIAVGFAAQSMFALTSPLDRGLSVSLTSLRSWVDAVTDSALSLVPGMSWTGTEFHIFPVATPWYGAWMVTILLAIWGVRSLYLSLRGSGGVRSAPDLQLGLLIAMALGLSLFPSLAGEVGFRYFVAPVVLVLIGLLIRFDDQISRANRGQFMIGSLLVALLWAPAFAASQVRSSPAPSWHEELDRVRLICVDPEVESAEILFTPVWPGDWIPDVPKPEIVCSDL